MKSFKRILSKQLSSLFFKGKTIVLIGPRQVGKTTLIKGILESNTNFLFLDGDDITVRNTLSNANSKEIERIIGKHTILFIDEAQRIDNIGITAKIIHDQFKEVQLILSGSSALDLNSSITEPLTGRKLEYILYPISWEELVISQDYLTAKQQLNNRIIYGMYPDIFNNPGNEVEILKNLSNSYLYKDILALSNIKKPELLDKLVKALAYQIGNEVSYNELANLLQVSKETISSYIELLEKAMIVFKLHSYSRNLRNEIKTNKKIYFYDTGIRNAVINNFNPIDLRSDKGALWENFIIAERIKYLNYHQKYSNFYFWRTKYGREIDWIEERDGELSIVEFKWKRKPKHSFPKQFIENYLPVQKQIIDTDNYYDFIIG